MVILVKVVQFIFSLTILVLVHELGHFTFARMFKTKVEKFRIFFDYKFTLWKKQIGETDFGIGWIPLGGYVKIAGMIDESMDREQMKRPPQPWEFRAKPAWQRFFIMVGGVLYNMIFAWLLYSLILCVWGERYLPNENVKDGVVCTAVAKEIGFENGDKIISVYGQPVERFSDINADIFFNAPGEVEVMRQGKVERVFVRSDEIGKIVRSDGVLFAAPRVPFYIAQVISGSGAERGGLKAGDQLVGLNGDSLRFYDQYVSALAQYKGIPVNVAVLRDGIILDKEVQIDSLRKLGVYAVSPYSLLDIESLNYAFLPSLSRGLAKARTTASEYLKQLKLLASPEIKASESVGGFISIGKIFPGVWNWQAFWELTAFLSILLGVMNILPIPALDGGHVVLLIYEMVTRRKPSQRFLEVVQIIGMVLIFALLIFANANDIIRLFK